MKKILAFILCITMLIPCAMFNTFAQDSDSVESGKVLYDQQFGENFVGKDFADAGLTPGEEATGASYIDQTTGYLESWVNNNCTDPIAVLPDILPSHRTYTIEVVFRFTTRINNTNSSQRSARNSAAFSIGFNGLTTHSDASPSATDMVTVTHGSWNQQLNFSYDSNAALPWKLADTSPDTDKNVDRYGEWVKLTLSVKDDCLSKLVLACDGTTLVFDQPQNTDKLNSTKLYIANRQAGLDISSIRVVEGVDFANVTNAGVQPGTDGKSARLVAEIADSKFAAAGFKVSLSYTNATTNETVTTGVNDKKANYAYTSLVADTDRGIEQITPKDGYYLIAIVIEEIPDYVTDLKITFTPYATTADGDTYTGQVYVYDVAAQTVDVQ